MYDIYLWKIKPLSSFMTPWQSDTIYGHLLWGAKLIYGDDEVEKIIKAFKEEKAPFIVSNGFLGGRLPMIKKDLIKRSYTEEFSKIYDENIVETVKKLKEINKIKNVSIDIFNKLRGDYSNKNYIEDLLRSSTKSNELKEKKHSNISSIMHNNINRLTGTTVDNGIFSLKESFVDNNIYIFIKVNKSFEIGKMKKLLKFMEDNGFGKKVSVGKGAFKEVSFEKYNKFETINNSNAFVVLSNYIPKENDYSKVISENHLIKRGKIGNIEGEVSFPFKKPFSCFGPGSLFEKGKNEKYGKVLNNIHYDNKIVQIGIPFTLEVKI